MIGTFFRAALLLTVGAIQLFPQWVRAQTSPHPPFASPLRAVDGVFPNVRRAAPLSHAEALGLQPMDHFKECEACPEMVVVPAGEFVMGSPEHEFGSFEDERPQHVVTIAKPFAVGRFAVTFDQWDACVAAGACRYRPSDRGWGRAGKPVLNILWNDAKEYLWWLSRITGRPYRLLSEAEREYVTRAGTVTAFWWGALFDPAQANSDALTTVLVHSFAANPWGLYQVHGNVYDWVEDCWNDNYDGAPSDGSAWTVGNCDGRVLRGGAFNRKPQNLRSAARLWSGAPNRRIHMSVRVARTLAQ